MSAYRLIHTLDRQCVYRKYSVKLNIPFKNIQHCLAIVFQIKPVPFQIIRICVNLIFFHNTVKLKVSLMIWRFHCHRTSEMENLFASVPDQRLCRQTPSFFMIHRYHRNMFSQIPVQRDNRLMYFLIFLDVKRMYACDNAVHNMTIQHIQIFQFCIMFFRRITQHHFIPDTIQFSFCAIYEFREKRIRNIRHKNCNNTGPFMVEISCQFIWRIVQLFHRNLYFLSGFFSHISTIIQHSGDCTYTDIGSLCYIFDPCHCTSPFQFL